MKELPLEEYMQILSSSSPVPGGGGAAAVGGALGMGLANMVGALTVGKKRYAEFEEEVIAMQVQGKALQEELLALSEQDALVFEPLARLYALPRETETQIAFRQAELSKASIEAAKVPMLIAEKCLLGMHLCSRIAEIGSKLAVSDAGCGIVFLKAAVFAALYNVQINLPLIHNELFVQEQAARIVAIKEESQILETKTLEFVENRL